MPRPDLREADRPPETWRAIGDLPMPGRSCLSCASGSRGMAGRERDQHRRPQDEINKAGAPEYGDLLVADRLVADRGRDFRFIAGLDWETWTGSAWRPCELGEHVEAVKDVTRAMWAPSTSTCRTRSAP